MVWPGYDGAEVGLKKQIDELHMRWINWIVSNNNGEREEELRGLYVTDGFYPNYTKQRIKILFIGKEGLELSGEDYIECLYDAYLNRRIGSMYINQHRFHSTMLYIAYALERRVYEWSKIPYADELVEEFGRPDGISFAFMNLSKFSNESGDWMADEKLIDSFLRLSECPENNFFGGEICLLNPDIIIGMNLGGRMAALGRFENPQFFGDNHDVCFQTLITGDKRYNYLDTWHFSAPGKSPEWNIFNPVITALKQNLII